MRRKWFLILIALILPVCLLTGCGTTDPPVAEDEIMLKIRLDLKEDIGLLVIDADLSGVKTSGGISNADRTPLKRDEVLYWSFSRQDYGISSDTADLVLYFRIITEYFDPNYENIYPEEYTVPLDEVSLTADFGKLYTLKISGDESSGYQAVFESPQN